MADATQEINYAGKHLVVDSIEVINNIESQQVREIATKLNTLQSRQDSYNGIQANYWSNLSSDKKITALEKKSLYKEWKQVEATYAKLYEEAESREILLDHNFATYTSYYNALDTLLNTTLHLFDNMNTTSEITDRSSFDAAYRNYYTFENYIQMVLADQHTDEYWEQLSNDNWITPIEKKSLLQRMNQIDGEYEGFKTQAEAKGLTGLSAWNDYKDDYQDLHDYLYSTLAVFDNMEQSTYIESREDFNTLFENYNSQVSFMSVALNTSIMESLGFRVLESLTEPGVQNEVGLYHGSLYQYVVNEGIGIWQPVGSEGFVGTLSELPATEIEGQYFLCASDFTRDFPLTVFATTGANQEPYELLVNGDNLYVNYKFEQGYIYECHERVWTKVTNTQDYRYLFTMLDYYNITQELPPLFQSLVEDASQASAEAYLQTFRVAKYLGPFQADPVSDVIEGDWYLYTGSTTSSRTNSTIYWRHNDTWLEISPTDSSNSGKYMEALYDLLVANNAGAGYFTALFCQALVSTSVFTNLISTMALILRTGGKIQSQNYTPGSAGFIIESNGNAVFEQGTFKGDLEGAGGTFSGNLNAAGGTFSGDLNAAGGTFSGDLNAAGGTFSGNLNAAGGTFRGDISAATGTFNGNVDANSFTVKVSAGDNITGTFSVVGNNSRTAIPIPRYASCIFPAHGSVNLRVRMNNSYGGSNGWTVKKNGETIGTFYPESETGEQTYYINGVSVSTGDEFQIMCYGDKQSYTKLDFLVANPNMFLKSLMLASSISV